MTLSVRRESSIAVATPRGSPPTSVTSEASRATSAPVPMAMPTSARARAGASLTAVADHRHSQAAGLDRGDRVGLAGRQDLGQHAFGGDAHGGGHRHGRPRLVARHEPDLDPGRLQFADRRRGLRLDLVDGRERPGQAAVDRQVRDRRSPWPRDSPAGPTSTPPAARKAAVPTSTSRSSTRPRTPRPATASKPSTARRPRPASSARARIAAASGCSLPRSTDAARSSTSSRVKPGAATTSPSDGRPRVSVPVLSKITASTSRRQLERLAAADHCRLWGRNCSGCSSDRGLCSHSKKCPPRSRL